MNTWALGTGAAASLQKWMRVVVAFGMAMAGMSAHAASVQLDPAYGVGGIAASGAGPADERLRATVVQPDGKIVMAGACSSVSLCLIRLNTDGSPDPAFNGNGRVVERFNLYSFDMAALALQPDGKLLVGGWCGFPSAFCVARRNADGTADSSFNGTGIATTKITSGYDRPADLALQSDGKIVMAGSCGMRFCALRYNANGSLDTAFANAGKLIDANDAPFAYQEYKVKIAIQNDDKLVAFAYCQTLNANCLRRYLVDGQPDPAFGAGGAVAYPSNIRIDNKMVLNALPDGRIVLAATDCPYGATDFCVARFLSNGTLEAGVVQGSSAYPYKTGIALLPDGKVLLGSICGTGLPPPNEGPSICVRRYNADGTLDTSFGSGGTLNTSLVSQNADTFISVLPDGKIFIGGTCLPPALQPVYENPDFCAVRATTAGALDASFLGMGQTLLKVARSDGIPRGAILQPDGKVVMAGYCNTEVTIYTPIDGADTCLLRFTADGKLDGTFNGSGSVQLNFSGDERNPSLALQPDGKIVVVSNCSWFTYYAPNDIKACIARLNADGTLDATFNGQGYVAVEMVGPGGHGYSQMHGVAIQPDGKIVIAGMCRDPSVIVLCLARVDADGSPDASFGVSGRVFTPAESGETLILNYQVVTGQIAMADGNILVASQCAFAAGTSDFCLTRYLPNGTLDTTFNGTGWVHTSVSPGDDLPMSMRVLPDGRILLAGNCGAFGCMARYQSNGAVDTTFGGTGTVLANVGEINAIALRSDGKFLTVGQKMARWNEDGTFDATFNFGSPHAADVYALFAQVLPGGALVVAGFNPVNNAERFAAARYLPTVDTIAALNFTTQTGVPAGGVRVSNTITVSGFSGSTPISVSGGEYSIGCTAVFTSSAGTINAGDTVCVRHTSSIQPYTSTVTALLVGAQQGLFVTTTSGDQMTVSVAIYGVGSVTSQPAGIDCGANCVAAFPLGTRVTLTALPAGNNGFYGWGGANSELCEEGYSAPTCTITVNTPVAVNAAFNPKATLTVTKSGSGSGLVTSAPAGISCGTDCSADFVTEKSLRLTATPDAGSAFIGWTSGGSAICTNASTCDVSLIAARSITARFERQVALTVTKTGAGSGTVTSVPFGINCGPDCTETYSNGSTVTLTWSAAAGSTFVGWNVPGCTTLGNCTIVLSGDTVASAHFVLSSTLKLRSDFNADGRSDILWHNSTDGRLFELQMNGLTAGASGLIDHEPDLNWKVRAVADLSGDGRADIVWQNDVTGQVFALIMNGLAVTLDRPIYAEPDTNWKIVGAGDFNGDGKADLLWKNAATGDVFLLLMNGLAVVSGGVIYSEPNQDWVIQKVADFNGDGKADIVWRNTATGDVFLMLMDGTTVTGGGVIYGEPNTNWQIQAAADFNGDGKADILWRNIATGDVFMMLMNGTTIVGGSVFYGEPNADWKIVATGDYNGDGKADILWRNTTTGQVYMMLMNGATISSGDFVYTEPDQAWKILGP